MKKRPTRVQGQDLSEADRDFLDQMRGPETDLPPISSSGPDAGGAPTVLLEKVPGSAQPGPEWQTWGTAPAPTLGGPSSAALGSAFPHGGAPTSPALVGPGATVGASTRELVTCPECGEMAMVDSARRQADDFCRKCDFPLFWARTTVVLPSGEETGASLRRLPGTVGRAATASVACPHCGEPNAPTADICVRCSLSMHPAPPPPPPEPVYVEVPRAEPELIPREKDYPLWWIILVCASVLVIVTLLLWVALA